MKTSAQIVLIARAVFLELARKRDLYVAVLLMALFAGGAFITRVVGVEKPAVGTFLLNLGLSLAYYAAHILTLLLAAGQLPNEIENRTLYPLLAKPVSRGTVLLGKWLACSLAGCGTFFALAIIGWIAAPKMESYDATMLLQTVLLIPFSIALLAALSILFSLVWTKGVSFVLLGVLFFAGDKIFGFASRAAPVVLRSWIDAFSHVLPDFSKLNLITRYTDGIGPLPFFQEAGLILYATMLATACLILANQRFSRRPL